MTFEEKLHQLKMAHVNETVVKRISLTEFKSLVMEGVIKLEMHVYSFDNFAGSQFDGGMIEKICINDSDLKMEGWQYPWIRAKTLEGSFQFNCMSLAFLQDVGYGYLPPIEAIEDCEEDICRMHCVEDCKDCEKKCPCRECEERECKSEESCTNCEYLECECGENNFEVEEKNIQRPHAGSTQEIAEIISKAAGKEIYLNVVNSIGGHSCQAQAELDGKTVTIGRGLANIMDEEELAGIIAHELAHQEQRAIRDATPSIGKTKEEIISDLSEICSSAMTGSLLSRTLKAAAIGISITAAAVGGVVISKSRRREDETDADLRAVEILNAAGYDPNALVRALKKMEHMEPRRADLYSTVMATHPKVQARIEKMEDKINSLKNTLKK